MNEGQSALLLGAALACGLMIGMERGWRLRDEAPGTRVAGLRTFALLGAGGGLAGLLAAIVSPAVTAFLALALASVIVIGYARDAGRRDSTTPVAAIVALALGLLAGAGEASLAVTSAAITTLLLATRRESHAFIERLNREDVRAFARYSVIVLAVLPFLPHRQVGPLHAWNPFNLWLVVVLVTGFSFVGYVASRAFGARRGILVTALIGGAYSSTAVTASLSQTLGKGGAGPLSAGIGIATAVMYLRVILLVAVLTPSVLPAFVMATAPAAAVAALAALILWLRAPPAGRQELQAPRNPIEILPALGFATIVAAAAVFARWAQLQFGQSGVATSLFLTGSFDVDAAIVTLSGLPLAAIGRDLAALALGGTIVANMALKMGIVALYARGRGTIAIVALGLSMAVLLGTLLWRATIIGLI